MANKPSILAIIQARVSTTRLAGKALLNRHDELMLKQEQTFMNTWRGRLAAYSRHWSWTGVLVPFAITRLILLFVSWFSLYFSANPHYSSHAASARGWHITPIRLVDVWYRWDSDWYMSIIREGYHTTNPALNQNNQAFFPLYPLLVKLFGFLLPDSIRTDAKLVVIGILLSNLFLIGACLLLFRMVADWQGDEATARRTISYLLLFPTAFVFSAFYTESTFLFFSVAAVYAASQRRWLVAGLSGGLAALARSAGILLLIPVGWMYLESIQWNIKRLRLNALNLMLIPLGLFSFLCYIGIQTGYFWGPFIVQAKWDKHLTLPWIPLLQRLGSRPYMIDLDVALTVLFLVLSIAALLRLKSLGLGLYSLALTLLPLTTGTMTSTARYCSVIFPGLIVLALWGKRPWLHSAVQWSFLALQILLMFAWGQFYWAG